MCAHTHLLYLVWVLVYYSIMFNLEFQLKNGFISLVSCSLIIKLTSIHPVRLTNRCVLMLIDHNHDFLEMEHALLYSVSPSPGSDVSTQVQLVSACTHYLFCVRVSQCARFHLSHDLEQHFANNHATSLPGDGKTEYILQNISNIFINSGLFISM